MHFAQLICVQVDNSHTGQISNPIKKILRVYFVAVG